MPHRTVTEEAIRIKKEYARRESEVDVDLYAPWQPGEILMTAERKRVAASMLKDRGRFPEPGSRCLEIGFGKLGWLADLISWGVRETDLFGIELDANRAAWAIDALPAANLLVGDGTDLPWEDKTFDYVIVSTVFSSILDESVRRELAHEVSRVLRPGGIVIVYDLAVHNPRNKGVTKINPAELRSIFRDFDSDFRSTTLAPPLAHAVAKRSWILAEVLSAFPFLRTHFLATMIKP
jgi:SAM-dependent methyltransferase